jgi:tetratricopeptide (TPR) repeat protein
MSRKISSASHTKTITRTPRKARVTSLPKQLSALEAADLVRLAQRRPHIEYLFRHGLVQDAAYQSLLRADRRTLHQLVGETLEQLHPEQLPELAPVLARHFNEAGDEARALKYFTQAGDEAARVYANVEAIAHYTRALNLAKAVSPDVAGVELLLQRSSDVAGVELLPQRSLQYLYTRLGRVLELSGQYPAAAHNYQEMESVAHEHGNRAMELAALMAHATIRSTPNPVYDPPQGQALLERARGLAHALGDRAAEAKLLWNLLLVNVYSGGDAQQMKDYGEQSLALARELQLREQLAFTLNDLWYPYVSLGQWARMKEALAEARELWREMGNMPMLAENEAHVSHADVYTGDYDQAMARAQVALRISQESNNVEGQASSRFMIGLAYIDRGRFAEAVQLIEELMGLGVIWVSIGTRSDLGWAYGLMGAVDKGLQLAQQAQTIAETQFPILLPWALAVRMRLHLLQGQRTMAEALATQLEPYRIVKQRSAFIVQLWLHVGIAQGELACAQQDYARAYIIFTELRDDMRQLGVRLFYPDVLYHQARALRALGRHEEAHIALTEACAIADAIGSRRMAWQILAALSEDTAQRGNEAEAQQLRAQAYSHIIYIAEHCPSELCGSFLSLPAVQVVMG